MAQQKYRCIQAVSNIIKKLKSSSGLKKEKYISETKKLFKLDENEKWVVTKLRMILVRLQANMEFLQIEKKKRSSPKKQYAVIQKQILTTVILKTEERRRSKVIFAGNKGAKQQNCLKNQSKPKQQKSRMTRKSLEEKQLSKLRSVRLEEETNSTDARILNSKMDFLQSFNLIPNVVYIS